MGFSTWLIFIFVLNSFYFVSSWNFFFVCFTRMEFFLLKKNKHLPGAFIKSTDKNDEWNHVDD